MDVEPTVCLSPADADVVCVAPKKKARGLSHIWTDEDAGVFLSLMQGDETTMASNAMSCIENQDRTCLVQILLSHTFLP